MYPSIPLGDGRSGTTIGRGTAILDNARVERSRLGAEVTISPGANVVGAEVGDGAMIGMGARVLEGAVVGKDAFVDAGAVVGRGVVVPAGALWTGNPGRQLRVLSGDEMSYLRSTALQYAQLGVRHAEAGAFSPAELEAQEEEALYRREHSLPPSEPLPVPDADVLEYYKLTDVDASKAGLFRDLEYKTAEEVAARLEEEVAAGIFPATQCVRRT